VRWEPGTEADQAGGEAQPNFLSKVKLVTNDKNGRAISWPDGRNVAWTAFGWK